MLYRDFNNKNRETIKFTNMFESFYFLFSSFLKLFFYLHFF